MNKTNWIIAILVGIAFVCTLITYAESLHTMPEAPAAPVISTTTQTKPVSTTHTQPSSGGILIHTFGDVTLSVGQTAKFSDVTIVPVSIDQDSRCPLGTLCTVGFQAGTVEVSTRITSASGTLIQTLALGKSFTIGHDVITLTGVEPVKRRETTIPQSSYQLTFSVEPTS
ncbi:MAG: hypothetical protein JWM39_443 [Parcubacteria group bacterium]|nr:hypothetical protein [Parcubacteria group bacterium]